MTVLIIHFFEILAAILAIVHRKKYINSTESMFVYLLWFTVFIEFTGYIVGSVLKNNNAWVFNIYAIISFLFYFYWYFNILKKKTLKNIIIALSLVFVIIAIKTSIYESWKNLHIATFVFGAITIVIASIFYFSELLNSNEVINIKYKLRFWIATGLLLFHVGFVPFIIFSKEFGANSNLRNIILVSLNILLYTNYSLGFIWTKADHN